MAVNTDTACGTLETIETKLCSPIINIPAIRDFAICRSDNATICGAARVGVLIGVGHQDFLKFRSPPKG